MSTITIIPSTKAQQLHLRVAAYCRVKGAPQKARKDPAKQCCGRSHQDYHQPSGNPNNWPGAAYPL